MSEIIVDRAALLEPNLLLPFKAPVNHTKLNPYWKYYKDLFYVYAPGISRTTDLITRTIGTEVGNIVYLGNRWGLAARANSTGSYFLSNVGNPLNEPYNTILCICNLPYTTGVRYLFTTRRNETNPTFFSGIFWYTTSSSSTFYMGYGDNSGSVQSSDTRLLYKTGFFTSLNPNMLCSMVGCFKSSTTGSLYVNGKPISLSATGSGGSVAGTGNLIIHNCVDFSTTYFSDIILLAIFNTILPDSVMQSLSADPYQIFTAL